MAIMETHVYILIEKFDTLATCAYARGLIDGLNEPS